MLLRPLFTRSRAVDRISKCKRSPRRYPAAFSMNRIPTSQPRNRKSATRERGRLHHGPTEGKCSRLLLIRLGFIAFYPIMIYIIPHLHPSRTPALTTRVFPQQTCRCDRTPLQSEYPPSGIPTPAAPPQYRSPPDPGGAEPVYRRRSAR